MFDTLLPLFSSGPSHVEPDEARVQPMQVLDESTNQPIFYADVRNALDDERTEI